MTQISYHNIRNNYNNWDNTSKQSSHVPQSASLQNANKAAAWTDSILCTRYTALFSVDVEMSPLNSRVVLLQWHSFRLATLTDVSVAWAVFFFSFLLVVLCCFFGLKVKQQSHGHIKNLVCYQHLESIMSSIQLFLETVRPNQKFQVPLHSRWLWQTLARSIPPIA